MFGSKRTGQAAPEDEGSPRTWTATQERTENTGLGCGTVVLGLACLIIFPPLGILLLILLAILAIMGQTGTKYWLDIVCPSCGQKFSVLANSAGAPCPACAKQLILRDGRATLVE